MASQAQPALWRETVKAGAVRSGALIAAAAIAAVTLALALALASYHPADPAINTAAGEGAANLLGAPGAWIADLLLSLFGPVVAALLPVGPILASRLWRDVPPGRWGRMLRGATLGTALMASALAFISTSAVLALPAGWGGVVGIAVAGATDWMLAFTGEPLAMLWGARAVGVVMGVAGVVIWARSLEIDLSEHRWRLRRPRRAVMAGDDADAAYADDPYADPYGGDVAGAEADPDGPAPLRRGRKLVVQIGETFGDGNTPMFVERLAALDLAEKLDLDLAPVMVYADDVTHIVTEEGIANLLLCRTKDEREQAIRGVAGYTDIGRGRDKAMVERLRERRIIQRPQDLGIDPLDADRSLLAAHSIKDLMLASGGLYRPPSRFRNW